MYDTDSILNDLRLARAYCADKLVWFAPALYQCKIHLTEQIHVAAIDRNYNLYFNPMAVLSIKNKYSLQSAMAQLGFIWIHEISHTLRDHAERAEDLKAHHRTWNIAADFEINDGNWDGLEMPKDFPGILPMTYKLPNGKLTEWYYHEIFSNLDLQLLVEEMVAINWDEGSGVHAKQRIWEIGGAQQQLHPIDIALIKRQVAHKMQEYRKFIGSFPGSWDLWVEKVLDSQVNWRKILHHRMSTAIATGIGLRVNYSFARPSRRQSVYQPIITPSFSGEQSGNIAVVVDTSGSMGDVELGQAVGEVCGLLEQFKMPVTIIPCDAQAYKPFIVKTPADRFKIRQLKGGGGTNMVVGIEAALQLRPKPDTILILTDGYTPYPEKPYKLPIVFGIIKRDTNQVTPQPLSPPWNENSIVDIVIIN